MTMADRSEYNRPRRPNPDTISYLRSLPLDVETSSQEVSHFLEALQSADRSTVVEYPQTIAAALSALDEIQHEIASLAGDELSAEIIEMLAHITAPYSELATRKLLASTAGYALHLATHRYGSHVLQTILQLSITSLSTTDLALVDHPDAPRLEEKQDDVVLPSLIDLLVSLQDELSPHAWDLAMHVCGSHVLRTLLCVLGGVEIRQSKHAVAATFSRRGKPKKKKKRKTQSADDSNNEMSGDGGHHSRMVFITCNNNNSMDPPRIDAMHPAITKSLQELVESISGNQVQPPGDLQQLACHSSGGPLLSVLLRVLTYRSAREEWCDKLNEWETKHGTIHANHHLDITRPEPHFCLGSEAHGLAQRLLCWQSDKTDAEQEWAGDVIYGLAGELRGSHCLETLLHLVPDEFYESILQVGDLPSRKTLQLYAKDDVSKYIVQTVLTTVRNKEQAQTVLQNLEPMVSSGFVLDAGNKRRSILWRMVETASTFQVCQESILSSIVTGFTALTGKEVRLKACVTLLLGLKKPERDGDRVSLDVAGTRALHWMMCFEPKLCAPILKGLVEIPADEMELLIRDGLGSRCILDGILEGPVHESVFSNALSKLTTRLAGQWVALAGDRIGHHVVKKLFRALATNPQWRESLVQELVTGKKRLSGNSMGRSVLAACFVHEYEMNGAKEWHRLVKKQAEKETWLDDIVHGGAGVGEHEAKHKKQEDRPDARKKQRQGGNNVESIMDAITIPGKRTSS